ncbi:4Fe-4S single cluster domain-containing protein [Streptomyces sp. NPDC051940]|uniref:4Fe-4S single cluster domain-containing protein n=1 Tax=Streptomyces sp. NPDC051940 TaxID=3155675 RepID=UPI003447FA83
MSDVPWRLHGVLERSRANGPGTRFVVWTQGCDLGCAGCFNPGTHPDGDGSVQSVAELARQVAAGADGIEGVTVTGGEPLQQPDALREFVRLVRAETGLGIIVLSGYSRTEIEHDPVRHAAVAGADLVVAGRYTAARHLGSGLRGSSNKTYWNLTGRYDVSTFDDIPQGEIVVAADGTWTLTGVLGGAAGVRRQADPGGSGAQAGSRT